MEAIDFVRAGQERLKARGSQDQLLLKDAQDPAEVAKIEQAFGVDFPQDYKTFITEHGLLSFKAHQCKELHSLISMERFASVLESMRMDIKDVFGHFGDEVIDKIFPFQYILDANLVEYYSFRTNPETGELYIFALDEDWERLGDGRLYEHASSFTEHIEKFVLGCVPADAA